MNGEEFKSSPEKMKVKTGPFCGHYITFIYLHCFHYVCHGMLLTCNVQYIAVTATRIFQDKQKVNQYIKLYTGMSAFLSPNSIVLCNLITLNTSATIFVQKKSSLISASLSFRPTLTPPKHIDVAIKVGLWLGLNMCMFCLFGPM